MPTRNTRPRLLAYAKISDYQVEKVVAHFARGESALHTTSTMQLSYVTVRKLYELIRRRLIEIAYFSSLDAHAREAFAEDDEDSLDDKLAAIAKALAMRRGVNERTRADHEAELLFRLEESRIARPHGLAGDLFPDMMKALRLSGHLNRPLTDRGQLRATEFLLRRTLDKRMAELLLTLDAALPEISHSDSMKKAMTSFKRDVKRLRK